MFFSLLLVTLITSVAVAFFTVSLFDKPIARIFQRIVAEELSEAWHRYIRFAAYVVGISSGVRIYDLERYITPRQPGQPAIVLNAERWTLEVYRTVISTLQSIAWMFLVVLVVALIAFVLVRGFELRAERATDKRSGG